MRWQKLGKNDFCKLLTDKKGNKMEKSKKGLRIFF